MVADLHLRGVYVPTVTPFTEDDEIDLGALERLCHEYLDAGASGIVALATTGEASALDDDERAAVVACVSRVCEERSAQLIVGAGTNNTKASVEAAGRDARHGGFAHRGPVLRAPLRGGDHGAHPGGGGCERGPGDDLQHPIPHGSSPWSGVDARARPRGRHRGGQASGGEPRCRHPVDLGRSPRRLSRARWRRPIPLAPSPPRQLRGRSPLRRTSAQIASWP